MSPACCEFQIAGVRIERAFATGDEPDGLQALGLLQDSDFGIKERRKVSPQRRGRKQGALGGRKRYARPVLFQSTLILNPVHG